MDDHLVAQIRLDLYLKARTCKKAQQNENKNREHKCEPLLKVLLPRTLFKRVNQLMIHAHGILKLWLVSEMDEWPRAGLRERFLIAFYHRNHGSDPRFRNRNT
ncbi:hypothetical protein CDAR_529061 [Caerostris darwini]|uniref:Uncharacterized protein n=1 Tax=Caerostris darwini TaxID=1538125 RepID=A0AAV4UD04_9ARAC|nr:hypothetical protein CDAR_529061 [Caerostris darwini]